VLAWIGVLPPEGGGVEARDEGSARDTLGELGRAGKTGVGGGILCGAELILDVWL